MLIPCVRSCLPRVLACVLSLGMAALAHADITLAGVTEVKGPGAAAGTAFRNGYLLAIEEINAAGGVLGQRLKLQQFDIDTKEAAVVDAMGKAVALEPLAVMGPVFSGLTLAAMPQTAAARVPHFTGGEAPSLTSKFHPTLLRTSLTQQESLPRLTSFAVYGLGAKKLGLLWLDNEFGRGGRAVLQTAATRRGGAITYEEAVPAGQKDWAAIVGRLATQRVDALILLLTEEEAVSALAELRRQHYAQPILGDGPMVSTKVVADAHEAADGVIGHTGTSVDVPSPRMQQFVADYQRRFNSRPDHNSLKGYFAVQALRIGLLAVGKPDRAALLDHLKNVRLDGRANPALLSSSVRYDQFGDLNRESYILRARGGRMQLIATLSALDAHQVTLPNGRSLAFSSDEFRKAVDASLSGAEPAPPAKR